MKALVSVIRACSARSKFTFHQKIEPFRLFSLSSASASLLTFESSSFEENRVLSADNCIGENNDGFSQNVHATCACISGESSTANYRVCPSFQGNDMFKSVNDENDSVYWFHQRPEDIDRFKRIKSILANYGWNFCFSKYSYRDIVIDQHNVIRILNSLYEESRDASLAFFFYQWSQFCGDSTHSLPTICRMIHILISGNMNHRSIDLLCYLARENNGEDQWHLLMKVLHETHIDTKGLGTAYSMLVDCFIKENMMHIALELSRQMKCYDLFPSKGVINSLIRGLIKSEQIELAWDYLEEIQIQGLVADASIMSLFIQSYCRKGNLKCAWKLLSEMKNYGITPDVVVYTILINALCKACLIREATSLLFKMAYMGITPDSICVSSVIDGICKTGGFDEAIKILKIFRLPPNIYIYNSFIAKLCRDGNMALAFKIFQEMIELGFLPDCHSYTTILGGYCKLGDFNGALIFWGKILKSGVKASVATYTTLIDCSCKSGDVDTAEYIFLAMIKEGLVPDMAAYNTLINGYGRKGGLYKAFGILDMMKSAGISPDIVSYNAIIHGLILQGFVNEARDILDELICRGFSPDVVTFTNLITGYSSKGNFKEAYLMWFHLSDLRMKPDVVMCSALLYGYCRVHLMEEANSLFLKMLDIGLVPDVILYNMLIRSFCYSGNMDDACRLVNMMVRQGIIPNDVTYQALTFGYKKDRARNPVETAAFKLQQILEQYGFSTDVYFTDFSTTLGDDVTASSGRKLVTDNKDH
ncbi:PPR domain-containing protein/PPR_1 domain-containing protein/PPR_2 domain-containing protein/PPR_3 domain-containing protein [Heracleum sosnowskyi]|uniref:PPR domain-containing protein/PPR_1 domain-containing protein/PPR_2 domain-containing protein/PPR_3 domain-containing protein n=1 Tax=Heracleum sosnowskyi TaxID=360622 RepID=A0AAD8J7F6_9APIA|nr:PPR domain-containing protein/PPR_1 domain-containing protein/PPR_2 domain-containing protein/PPR_3 domain-containing protein [Heracleum sosnowskyi]